MKLVVFLDLDDSLFQTRPKCPPGALLEAVAFRQTGEPLSYMTERQRALLAWFREGTVIPATARNYDAFRRVRLPFDSHAILDFGAVVLLPDGALDQAWDERIRPQALDLAEEFSATLAQVQAVSDRAGLEVRARIIQDFHMPLYLVVKHPAGDTSALRAIQESDAWPRDQRWFTHFNHNNLSLVPRFLGKEHAVAHVLATHFNRQQTLVVGCADSLSDAPFLELCDFAMLPQASQLAKLLGRLSETHLHHENAGELPLSAPPADGSPEAAKLHTQ